MGPRLRSVVAAAGMAVALVGCNVSSSDVAHGGVLFDLTLQDPLGSETHEFRQGETVSIVLRIENDAREAAVFEVPDGCPFDARVRDAAGREVWSHLLDAFCPDYPISLILEPGEIAFLAASWEQDDGAGSSVPPGAYTIRGELPGLVRTTPAGEPVPLTILPR